jgi:hypothetical protein
MDGQSDRWSGWCLERPFQAALVVVGAVGLRQRSPSTVVNAVAAFVGTLIPGTAGRWYGLVIRPWHRAYVGIAMLAHAVGMLGLYEECRWWDHLTHTLSATIVGGVGHVVARQRGDDPTWWVLATVGGLGVGWELLEYAGHAIAEWLGIEPLLVPYGRDDTLRDLLFDLVGAVIVLLVSDRLIGDLRE